MRIANVVALLTGIALLVVAGDAEAICYWNCTPTTTTGSYPSTGDTTGGLKCLYTQVTLNHLRKADITQPTYSGYVALKHAAVRCKNSAGKSQVLNSGQPFSVNADLPQTFVQVDPSFVQSNGTTEITLDYSDGFLTTTIQSSNPPTWCKEKAGFYADKTVVTEFVLNSRVDGIIKEVETVDLRQDVFTADKDANTLFAYLDNPSLYAPAPFYAYPSRVTCSTWYSSHPGDWCTYWIEKYPGSVLVEPTPPACSLVEGRIAPAGAGGTTCYTVDTCSPTPCP